MTDRQIRCFLALYETLNFSAAARQLFLTQPTLSYQIRTLEEELGTPLFTRTTCRVEPTEAGQLFAAFAQNVRQSYQAFQHALAAGIVHIAHVHALFAVCVGRKARDGHIGVARLDLSHNGIERDVLYIQFNAQIICQRLRQGSVQAHDIVVLVQELKRRIAGLCRYNEHALGLDGLHAVLLHIAARHCDAVVGFGSGRAGRGRSAYRAGRSRGSGAGRAGTAAPGAASAPGSEGSSRG